MELDLKWFVLGMMLAQAPWLRQTKAWSDAAGYFEDLTYADAIKKSEKCSRCTPGRPCMMEAMPKLPIRNNFDLEYAKFLTDDELNAKYEGQKNFCDCTADLWGGNIWRETSGRGCGEVYNDICERNGTGGTVCGEFEPCMNYTIGTYDCTCPEGKYGQLCNNPISKLAPVDAFYDRPFLVPFLYSPTFAPFQSDWFRGVMVATLPLEEDKLNKSKPRGTYGQLACIYSDTDDARNYCHRYSYDYDPGIWHQETFGKAFVPKSAHDARAECLMDLDKRIHFLDEYVCELFPPGKLVFRTLIPTDMWFRVDLNPHNPDAVMIPGDPVPVGRKFRLRIAIINGLDPRNAVVLEEYDKRFVTWRFNRGVPVPEPLNFVALYPLHFRQCTFLFTYTGCSTDQKTQPVYDPYEPIYLHASGQPDPRTVGCKTMEAVDSRWWVEEAEDPYEYYLPNTRAWAFSREPYPLNTSYSKGKDGFTYLVPFGRLPTKLKADIVAIHDFVQKGHPRRSVATEVGLEYQTRNLCYFRFDYRADLIRPKSVYFSQHCDDTTLVFEVLKPYYFYDEVRVEWFCIGTKDPSEPCTKVRVTTSVYKKFLETYKDFKYDGPLQCHDYVWKMKVTYVTRKILKYYDYTINVVRSREAIPVHLESLSASNQSLVDPDEPNYFKLKMTPFKPDVWNWNITFLQGNVTHKTQKPFTGVFQQLRTSTYICIIPPKTLKRNTDYVLVGYSKYGMSSYSFKANAPPTSCICTVKPKDGIAGVTEFVVTCDECSDGEEPMSWKVVESEGIDEMPWTQYTNFISDKVVKSTVKVFTGKVAALVFDSEGMYTRIPLEVTLSDPPQPPEDIIPRRERIEFDKVGTVNYMAQLTRHFNRLGMPIEEYVKIAYIRTLSDSIDHESPFGVFVQGVMILRDLFLSRLEKNPLMNDQVLKHGGEQLHNFAEIFCVYRIQTFMKYYDKLKIQEAATSIAGKILLQPDPVVIDDTIREDEHEAHKIRASKGSNHALQALDLVGASRRSRQYYQLQPTFNLTHEGLTLFAQSNNATTFNDEFGPHRMKGHTMTIPKTTANKYKGMPIYSVMITSEDDLFWWLPNDAGLLSVTADVDKDDDGNWTKADGPFYIYLKLKNFTNKVATASGILQPLPQCQTEPKLDRIVSVNHLKLPKGEGVVYMEFSKDFVGKIKVSAGTKERPSYDQVSKSQPLSKEKHALTFSNLDNRHQSDFYIGVLSSQNASTLVPYSVKYKIIQCGTFIHSMFEYTACRYVRIWENETDNPRIQCQCEHLSWFTATIALPPSKPVLTDDIYLYAAIVNRYYVTSVLLLLLLLFFLLLLWGRKKDRDDMRERHVAVLYDNWCSDTYPYVVAVFTGERNGSGTTSRVSMRVFGTMGVSRVHCFSHKRHVLRTGLDYWCLMKTPQSLGALTKIQLWHTHTGYSPDWYCQKVMIYDVKSEEGYSFIVERWFTFDYPLSIIDAQMCEVELLNPEGDMSKWHDHVPGWVFSGIRDKNEWASIFARHPRSLYTRCQQVVIVFGLISTAMMISMIFFYTTPGPSDLFVMSFNLADILKGIISAIIGAVLSFLVVFFFAKSKDIPKQRKQTKENKELQEESSDLQGGATGTPAKKNKAKKLMKAIIPKVRYEPVTIKPPETSRKRGKTAFLIMAWITALLVIAGCCTVMTLLGLKFGKKKTMVWAVSFMSGLFTESLILQPLKLLLMAILIAFLFKTSHTDTSVEMEVKYDEVKEEGAVDWRKCLKKMWDTRMTAPYHPVYSTKIEEIRAKYGSRKVRCLIFCGVICGLLLLLILLIIYALGVKEAYHELRPIRFFFLDDANRINSKDKMYQFIHHNVTPALHRLYWYSGKPLPVEAHEKKADPNDPRYTSKVKGFMQDYTNKLVGVPRIRQLRLEEGNVSIPKVFVHRVSGAYGKYYEFREDRESYVPEWVKHDERDGNIAQLWRYSNKTVTKTGYSYGKTMWPYSGAGYVVPLSWTKGKSWRILTNLEMFDWVTNRTRAVFFETNLYNNNLKLYTEMRFIIEALPHGVYLCRLQLRTASLFFQDKVEAKLIMILAAFLALVLLIFAYYIFAQSSREGCGNYFSTFRGYLDVVVFFAGMYCVNYLVLRALEFSVVLEDLEKATLDVHTPLQRTFSIDESAHAVFGFFILATVSLLTYTIYQAVGFKRFHSAISKIAGPLIVLVVVNITVTYLTYYLSSSIDHDPINNFFLHSALRDQRYTGKGENMSTRIFYIIVFPLVIILLKFNVACIIFFHLWFSDEGKKLKRIKTKKDKKAKENKNDKKDEETKPKRPGKLPIRLKGRSGTTWSPSEDLPIWLLKIQKLEASSFFISSL